MRSSLLRRVVSKFPSWVTLSAWTVDTLFTTIHRQIVSFLGVSIWLDSRYTIYNYSQIDSFLPGCLYLPLTQQIHYIQLFIDRQFPSWVSLSAWTVDTLFTTIHRQIVSFLGVSIYLCHSRYTIYKQIDSFLPGCLYLSMTQQIHYSQLFVDRQFPSWVSLSAYDIVDTLFTTFHRQIVSFLGVSIYL